MKNSFEHTNHWFRLNLFAQIILCLLLALLLNYLNTHFYWRSDLTHNHRFSLNPETKANLRPLKGHIEIFFIQVPVDYSEDKEPFQEIESFLNEYKETVQSFCDLSFSIENINVYKQKSRAEEIASRYQLLNQSHVIVASEKRYELIPFGDFYKLEDRIPVAFLGERVLTSATLRVMEDKPTKIYFTFGHGEMNLNDTSKHRGLSELKNLLLQKSFSLQEIDLSALEAVPYDADLLIVASPKVSFQHAEQVKLQQYLSQSKARILFFLDPGVDPRLEDLFYEWGILVEDRIIKDQGQGSYNANGNLIIRRFADHPITRSLVDLKINALMKGHVRPIRQDPGVPPLGNFRTVDLMASSPDAWGIRDWEKINPLTDLKDPNGIPLAVVVEKSLKSELGIEVKGSRIGIFGNSGFIANGGIASYGNQLLINNTIEWCLQQKGIANIPPRRLEKMQIALSQQEFISLGLLFFTIPLGVGILGIIVKLIRYRC